MQMQMDAIAPHIDVLNTSCEAPRVINTRDSAILFSVKEPMPKTTARLTLEGHAVKSLAGQALAGLMKPNLVSDLIQRGALR